MEVADDFDHVFYVMSDVLLVLIRASQPILGNRRQMSQLFVQIEQSVERGHFVGGHHNRVHYHFEELFLVEGFQNQAIVDLLQIL